MVNYTLNVGCYYRHDSTDPSTIDVAKNAKAAAEEALSFKESGFKAVKIKIGLLSVDDDLRYRNVMNNLVLVLNIA